MNSSCRVRTLGILHRGVEQQVAHRAHNPKVAGSNPAPATGRDADFFREVGVSLFLRFSAKLEADAMPIRNAVESDLAAIARVQACTMVASDFYETSLDEEAEYQRLYPRIVGYLAGTYNPSHALAERTLLVAAQEDQIVGFVAGHLSTRMGCTAELQWMFVLPHWQRQGIGARLLEPLQLRQKCPASRLPPPLAPKRRGKYIIPLTL